MQEYYVAGALTTSMQNMSPHAFERHVFSAGSHLYRRLPSDRSHSMATPSWQQETEGTHVSIRPRYTQAHVMRCLNSQKASAF